MAKVFLEQRNEPLGNTFINLLGSPYAHLLPSERFLDKTMFMRLSPPSLLRRRHSYANFTPYVMNTAVLVPVARSQVPKSSPPQSLAAEEVDDSTDNDAEVVLDSAVSSDASTRDTPTGAGDTVAKMARWFPKAYSDHVGAPPGLASPSGSASDGREGGITTVMFRNLPEKLTQWDLIQELNEAGWSDVYDFCYLPCSFTTRLGKCYAFVNFRTAEDCASFRHSWRLGTSGLFDAWSTWRRAWLFDCVAVESGNAGKKDKWRPIEVVVAVVQGLEENVRQLSKTKMARIRNKNYRPYVAADAAASVGWTEVAEMPRSPHSVLEQY